jgi:hypothetical protein
MVYIDCVVCHSFSILFGIKFLNMKTMRKINVKQTMQHLFLLLLVGTVTLSSCSKDDDDKVGGGIDVAVGTYKGKLSIRPSHGEFFDAVLIVTKVDNQYIKITAKSGEPYSNITEKTIKVESQDYNGDVNSVIGSLEGVFWYHAETKTLDVTTNKQSETDIYYYFEGAKQ